jgi:geranylgeranyl diphosphate synthase, type II
VTEPLLGVTEPPFLSIERERVDATLRAMAAAAGESIPQPLREPVEYALATSGKRVRPVLCIRAFRAAARDRDPPEGVYGLACALEVMHTYSLVHDDLPCMDDDDLRRGRPTLHRVFGTKLAILAGSALLPLAVEVLDRNARTIGLPDETRGRLVIELMSASGASGMVGGQLLDLAAERKRIDGAALEGIHRRKTGALLVASLRIGAIAGGADEALLSALTSYGEALGLAFQIADDLLDVEGTSADLGKTAGRDLDLAKASYPSLFGVEGARALAREREREAIHALAGYGLADLEALASYVVERRK